MNRNGGRIFFYLGTKHTGRSVFPHRGDDDIVVIVTMEGVRIESALTVPNEEFTDTIFVCPYFKFFSVREAIEYLGYLIASRAHIFEIQ